VLQSQLFILKVLAVCMASRWNPEETETRSSSRTGRNKQPGAMSSIPGSPSATTLNSTTSSTPDKRMHQSSTEHLSTPPGWAEPPPPLDCACAKYLLHVMVAFLRQTAPPEGRLISSANLSFEATFHDFESIEVDEAPPAPTEISDEHGPQSAPRSASDHSSTKQKAGRMQMTGAPLVSYTSSGMVHWTTQTAPISQLNDKFERTHKALARSHFSLNALILKFAGRIVYHLSASNWAVVLQKIRQKIRQLASSPEEHTDYTDLYLMKHSALDRARLLQIMQGN
jgi:hypothetical protein